MEQTHSGQWGLQNADKLGPNEARGGYISPRCKVSRWESKIVRRTENQSAVRWWPRTLHALVRTSTSLWRTALLPSGWNAHWKISQESLCCRACLLLESQKQFVSKGLLREVLCSSGVIPHALWEVQRRDMDLAEGQYWPEDCVWGSGLQPLHEKNIIWGC